MIKRTLDSQLVINFQQKRTGFTLIELLVVITIMGILMGILLVSYQGARVSARDGKRKADLEQIRSALQMYHSDCGQYPAGISYTGGSLTSITPPCPSSSVTYMTQIPQDPLYSTYQYRYSSGSSHAYALCAFLEGGGTAVTGCGGNCSSAACNYKVQQP